MGDYWVISAFKPDWWITAIGAGHSKLDYSVLENRRFNISHLKTYIYICEKVRGHEDTHEVSTSILVPVIVVQCGIH